MGLPLVVAGLGRAFNTHFNWWLGYAKKLPGSRRATQLIHALAPRSSVIWVDSTDTVFVNPLVGSAARAVDSVMQASARSRVLVGAECWSFPRCYAADYARDPENARCQARSSTCYPNSGTFLASSAGMDAFFAAQNRTWQSFLGTPMSNAECTHDQAVVQHMILNRTRAEYAHLDMQLDDESSFFLNLHQCTPPQFWKLRNVSMCYQRPYDPLRFVAQDFRDNASLLWFKPGLEAPQPTASRRRNGWHRPLIAHANGDHSRLDKNAGFDQLRKQLKSEQAALLNYPVLLVDPQIGDTCRVSTIGELYAVRTGNLMGQKGRAAAKPQRRGKNASAPAATRAQAQRGRGSKK